jgi:GNAT superfamily N-acetyltransferase
MNAQNCLIREATHADLPRLAPLFRAFLEETLKGIPDLKRNPLFDANRALARRLADEHSVVFAAELAGDLVAFACVEFRPATDRPLGLLERLREFFTRRRRTRPVLSPAHGCLVHLFVHECARRTGVASALVLASRDWVKRQGGRSLDLNVLAQNVPARALYRKLGMSEFLVHYRMEF